MKKLTEVFKIAEEKDPTVDDILDEFEIEVPIELDEDVEVLGKKLTLSEDLSFDFDKYTDETVKREIAADTELQKLHEGKDTRVRKIIQKFREHARNRIVYGEKK